MAGANTSRTLKMLVTNELVANTGNSVATVNNDDIVLVDKLGAQLADTATLQSNPNADVIRILLGKGAASATEPNVEFSFPIQVRNIRKVTIQAFQDAVQHQVKIVTATALPSVTAGSHYSIKVIFHDIHQAQPHFSEEFYSVEAVAGDTPATIIAKIKAKIDGNKKSRIATSMATNDLVLSGKAVTSGPNATLLNNYMFSYFSVALRSGFTGAFEAGAMVATSGKPGNGVGAQVVDLERQSTQSYYRDYTSFPNQDEIQGSPIRATKSGKYNLVVIEHGMERSGDLTQTFTAPATTIVAFATTDGTPSAKQTAFVEKLTSIVESAGVYVSAVVPSEV